jgi:hypothetical protein
MCMYAIRVCARIHTHTHIHTHIHTRTHTRTHVRTHVRTHAHTRACVCINKCGCAYAHTQNKQPCIVYKASPVLREHAMHTGENRRVANVLLMCCQCRVLMFFWCRAISSSCAGLSVWGYASVCLFSLCTLLCWWMSCCPAMILSQESTWLWILIIIYK